MQFARAASFCRSRKSNNTKQQLIGRIGQRNRGLKKAATALGTAFLGLSALVLTPSVRAASAPPLMELPGKFNVNATGGAEYTIPISVPPGTAGMQPSLSLTYSSQNGDGYLGIGWTLSGLPAITRCARTVAQDGVHGSVNFDTNDRFCMNGQRLINISGSYGSDGTEYRTEIESFSKIISYGSQGTGPAYFKVWTKAGQIMEFGNSHSTTNSQVLATGTQTVWTWAVNKVSDAKGNYFNVVYNAETGTDRTANGELYPIRIDYTANDAVGLSTYNSVQFGYGTRADVSPYYQAGSLIENTALMTDVVTYQGSNVVSHYYIAYDPSGGTSTRHSRVSSITLCGNSGCPPATTFTTTFAWQGTRDNVSGTESNTGPAETSSGPLDWNGDGLNDSVFIYSLFSNPIAVSLGTPNSPASYVQPNTWNFNVTMQSGDDATASASLPVDIDGDGVPEVEVNQYASGYYAVLLQNNGSGTFNPLHWDTFFTGLTSVVGDFNGDGRTDLWLGEPYGTWLSASTFGNWNFNNFSGLFPTASGGDTISYTGDFDGDGCTDVLMQGSLDHKIGFSGACAPLMQSTGTPDWTGYQILFGDFNGDGKMDVLAIGSGAASGLYLSTGYGFTAPISIPASWADTTMQVVVGDFNGDGKTDVALVPWNTGTLVIYLSTGTGFAQAGTLDITGGQATAADYNGDGASDLYINGGTTLYYSPDFVPEFISAITTGLGATTTITYDRLNKNGSFYAVDSSRQTYPVRNVDGPIYAVEQVSTSNGIGGNYTLNYSYAGAKTHQQGRGFLGFAQRTVSDPQTNIVTTTNYGQTFPYTGLVLSETRVHSGGTPVTLSDTQNYYCDGTTNCTGTTSNGVYLAYLAQSVVTSNDLDNTALPTVTTSYGATGGTGYDAYGNVLNVTVTTQLGSETSTRVTTSTYNTDPTNWFVGQLTTAQTVASLGTSSITRTSSFDYDGYGLVSHEYIEPNDTGALLVTTTNTYDSFGNKTQIDISGNNGGSSNVTRTTQFSYDGYGRFAQAITRVTSPVNETENWTYDARFGVPVSRMDANGIQTQWSYDDFGRELSETRFANGFVDQNFTQFTYTACVPGGCPGGVAYYVTSTPTSPRTGQNGPQTNTFYDLLSRVAIVDTQGFYNSNNPACWARSYTVYDANGRVQQVSRPFFFNYPSGCPTDPIEAMVNSTIDDLGRPTLVTKPNGGTVATAYHGLTTTVTVSVDGNSAHNQATTTTKNVLGLVKQVTDANGKYTTQGYDAYGDLLSITDPRGNVSLYFYDTRGRKIFACEPDKVQYVVASRCDGGLGLNEKWSYGYDAFGDVTEQIDANGNITNLGYDQLGRLTLRIEPGLVSTWTYGSSAPSIGKLTQTQSCTDGSCGTITAQRMIGYDSESRPNTVTLSVSGSSQATYTIAYDVEQRLSSVTYPSGFVAQYSYSTYGAPTGLSDGGGNVLWQALTRDAAQHITSEQTQNPSTGSLAFSTSRSFDPAAGLPTAISASGPNGGSGFTWTPTQTPCSSNCWGSSTWTPSALADLRYSYDYLGKVVFRSNTATGSENICYDALNRITGYNAPDSACTGSGTIAVAYDDSGNIIEKTDVCTSINCYSYPNPGSVRPYAIQQLGAIFNGVTEPTFTYDNNGNLTSGVGRTMAYTGFNMVSQMSDSTTTLCWTYDSYHQRVRMDQVSVCGGSAVSSTYYLNDSVSGAMAELIVSGSNTTWKDYLIVSGAMIGTRTVVNGSTPAYTYYVLDKMGSVAATTDQTGALLCRIPYDVWGNRGASGSACVEPTREYTGEETISAGALVKLVNLNARIYDPVLGRFMSADPVSGNPRNGQRLNAYTYALNSPLLYTDPTGKDEQGDDGQSGPPPEQVIVSGPLNPCGPEGCSYSAGGVGGSPPSDIGDGASPGGQPWTPSSGSTQPGGGVSQVGLIARTSTNAAPSPFGEFTYNGTLLKFTINPLAGSNAARYAGAACSACAQEVGLGNGGEDIIFQAVLAIVTFGVSIPEQLAGKGVLQLIGSFEVPEGLTFGTTTFGNYAHVETANLLQSLYPEVNFAFRVLPGQTGVDVEVLGQESIDAVGFQYGEIKPLTASGEVRFNQQILRWDLPAPVQPITYDAAGNVFLGFH